LCKLDLSIIVTFTLLCLQLVKNLIENIMKNFVKNWKMIRE